jgi:hypothetical protein
MTAMRWRWRSDAGFGIFSLLMGEVMESVATLVLCQDRSVEVSVLGVQFSNTVVQLYYRYRIDDQAR